jgi:hypothetical protein
MATYQADVARLSELETFDPRAFVGGPDWPQALCDFVLALALVYNDLKDIIVAERMLSSVRPKDFETPTPELGQFVGLRSHLFRNLAGLLHEFTSLVQRSEALVKLPKFEALVKNLPAAAREAWFSVLAAAAEKPSSNPIAMLLVRARNKVAFHYDAEEIRRGYEHYFLGQPSHEPYVSRGSSMAVARFYFVDAAAEAYMRNLIDTAAAEEFLTAATPLLHQINHPLRELVTRFVNARGFGWRTPYIPPTA